MVRTLHFHYWVRELRSHKPCGIVKKKKEGKEIYKTYCVECWIPGRTYCKLVMTRGLESNELALNPASVTYWQCDSGWITHLSQPQFLHLDTLKMPISKVSMRSK